PTCSRAGSLPAHLSAGVSSRRWGHLLRSSSRSSSRRTESAGSRVEDPAPKLFFPPRPSAVPRANRPLPLIAGPQVGESGLVRPAEDPPILGFVEVAERREPVDGRVELIAVEDTGDAARGRVRSPRTPRPSGGPAEQSLFGGAARQHLLQRLGDEIQAED